MADRRGVRRGQVVYGSDGVHLGRVFHCEAAGFVVERGLVFAEDYPVFYDEVGTVEGEEVRLRIPSHALVREEEAERWDPPRDPVGSAGGTDLEPLRAGMAEVEEDLLHLSALEAGLVVEVPRRGAGWAVRARLARPQPSGAPAGARGQAVPAGAEEAPRNAAAAAMELERRIAEEVEDFEREGGCALPGALGERELRAAAALAARLKRRLDAAARRGVALLRRGAGASGGEPAAAAEPPAPRRADYARTAPGALAALRRLETYVRRSDLEPPLLELVRLRVSQLNGCGPCVELHAAAARRRGVDDERLRELEAWRESDRFAERERAALEWTEAVTRVGAARVDDALYQRAREHLGERGLVDLTMAVVAINAWNRLAVAFEPGLGAYGHAFA
ncbi:carboxymuconolactone decarboxylase family protein [Anaeromyxobacter diazotrophicus]|nr:carboxymuconolactone decarboxylase family protein [Anaeromyxobacter diazotrophicus]